MSAPELFPCPARPAKLGPSHAPALAAECARFAAWYRRGVGTYRYAPSPEIEHEIAVLCTRRRRAPAR